MALTPQQQPALKWAFQRLLDGWTRRDESQRPWGMWVRLHEPLEKNRVHEGEPLHRVPLIAAWFLSESGLARQDPWSYLRFDAVHNRPLWYDPQCPPRLSKRPDIGMMALAPCTDPRTAYFEALFSGRDGYGMLVTLDEQGLPRLEDLWRS